MHPRHYRQNNTLRHADKQHSQALYTSQQQLDWIREQRDQRKNIVS